ncbi:amino acid ABC transporter ATP-binding protein [Mesorhizobium sp. Cs1299R1N1]|uniref:amino acid ABC transporter ATP-binding protein n=1 Tax=Mesorhizobium sp. Cs1299R1N1 TaxID=3015172 RepID=UPI00301D9229
MRAPRVISTSPLIAIDRLSKSFGRLDVLRDICLSVDPGEVRAIIGPSGSGKSTLLRCMNYLTRPDSGILRIGQTEIDASKEPNRAELVRLRRSIGMVFQSFNLFPHMTVLRNVCLAQERMLGTRPKEAQEKAMNLLHRVGMASKADEYPGRCSGGQQQRVAIARALALDPKIMLFDEPTSALDPELGLEVLAVMRELAESGMTMLVVTHEMHFAEHVSDRVTIMADCKIIEEGKSTDIIRRPQHERSRKFLSAVSNR